VIAHELTNILCSLRLANVYDLSSRIFLFKFASPNRREQLIVDSGFRCHLTGFVRAAAAAPSPFVAALRKHIRTRRVTSVSQVGTDRVIELQFSDGLYRLFLEFYAGGNLVLTDRDLTILSLQRDVPEGAEQEELRVGLKYALEKRQNYGGVPELSSDRVRAVLQNGLANAGGDNAAPAKEKRKPRDALRKALTGSMSEVPPTLVDHALRSVEFDASKPIVDVLSDDKLINNLIMALHKARQIVKGITSNESAKGFIFARVDSARDILPGKASIDTSIEQAEQTHENLTYEDFQPFKPLQLQTSEWRAIEFDSFNKAVDTYFSSIEGQRLESRLNEKEQSAKRKLETARQDYDKRIGGLQQFQELNIRKAQAIEANVQRVQEVIGAINGLISQGMDWVEIAQLVEMEQARSNVVAESIQLPLKLYENTVTLLLGEDDSATDEDFDVDIADKSDSGDEEDGAMARIPEAISKRLVVDIDLALSPWSNARQYYEQKKSAAIKEQKTIQSSVKALKNTEKKINTDLKKVLSQEKQSLRPVRKQLWFEKFLFFISSEGYLVLGGKDAQQNEILYKRYLRKGDIYVHADLPGTASIIIKNKPDHQNNPVPPSTLSQAGSFAVATSSAWDSKAVMSAWWVYPRQVSKTMPTGDYLTVGCFNIRGEKNYLPPAHLLLGIGVLFRVDEKSKEKHLRHRVQDAHLDRDLDGNTYQSTGTENVREEEVHNNEEGQDTPQNLDSSTDEGMGKVKQLSSNNEEDKQSTTSYGSDLEKPNPLLPTTSASRGMNPREFSESDGLPSISEDDLEETAVDGKGPAENFPRNQPSDVDPDEEPQSAVDIKEPFKTPPLLARERWLLQNDQPAAISRETTVEPDSSENDMIATASLRSPAEKKHSIAAQHPQVRGKHGKRSKLKTKYADQDEEDRTLAMHLLGSAATQKTAKEAAIKATKEEQQASQKRRRQQQHSTAVEKEKQEEKLRRIALEEDTDLVDASEIEALKDLEAYVGTPLIGDEIIDALVVCGPWDTIGTRCKWRAKMQPGSTKKGKAVREVLATWMRAIENREKSNRPRADEGSESKTEEHKVRRREGELLRGLREPEVVGVVPVGKVRVVLGGGGPFIQGSGGRPAGKSKRGGRGSKRQR
ncbi:MAG: hypothetical protein Q9219_007668, partial [cf. Caloplaca sp. 3 TL-2023]